MLSVTCKPFMLSVVMLSVVAPNIRQSGNQENGAQHNHPRRHDIQRNDTQKSDCNLQMFLEVFVTDKPFQPSRMFESKARAYFSIASFR
jgi:hypothetical protein